MRPPIRIVELTDAIESFAPRMYQESYDNSGMQVGDRTRDATGVLLTLDVTEAVIEEARALGCNLVIAHHPLIFAGIKSVTASNYVERTIALAIKHDIAIYAAHTNLDNMMGGVNAEIACRLGLQKLRILAHQDGTLSKLYTYVPEGDADTVRDALFAAGAGHISHYSECSFNTGGRGSFRPGAGANPAIGQAGGKREWVEEVKLEVLVARHLHTKVLAALIESHPYEEVAYELVALQNKNQGIGAGMVGELAAPMAETDFLAVLKGALKTNCIRHTALTGKQVQKIAVCGGSGSFLLPDAIKAGADFFVTADYKYHQFFDAEGKIVIADVGHYESEQFTPEILERILKEKFPTFAILLSKINTNPVKYYF